MGHHIVVATSRRVKTLIILINMSCLIMYLPKQYRPLNKQSVQIMLRIYEVIEMKCKNQHDYQTENRLKPKINMSKIY